MENSNLLVIFGGQDPEEAAARKVAAQIGCAIGTATMDGVAVHGGTAYRANGFNLDEGNLDQIEKTIIFECSLDAAGELPVVAHCDHHNPGDPGWGMGPQKFWEASSLGQLCNFFGVSMTPELAMVAAGDHCPAGAYAGLCPGVDPAEFGRFRIEGKRVFYASFPETAHKADSDKIAAAIAVAQKKIKTAPLTDAGVCDLRDTGFVEELPEAALLMGAAYMAAIPETDRDRQATGNTKIVLGGHTTPEKVRDFMSWAKTLQGRVGEPYGNPDRGFAGVVVKGN